MPDVDRIVQLSEFYGVTTDFLLKGDPAARTPGAPAPEHASAAGPERENASGAVPAPDGAAAFSPARAAHGAFVRVWPVLCLAGSAAAALLFCALWLMRGFWYVSTSALVGVIVVGTLAAAFFGVALFELGALAVPELKSRRVFFYSYAVWALALLPCCAVSGLVGFVFENWLWWRIENVFGTITAAVLRIGLEYLFPVVLYGGICTSLGDKLREEEKSESVDPAEKTD